MVRVSQGEAERWLSWGDMIVVLTALLLGLLGLVRHAKADGSGDALGSADAPGRADAPFDQKMFAGLRLPESLAPVAVSPAPPDVAAECCPPACDRRICHVLDPWGEDPLWSGRTEALLLWRDNPQGLLLFNDAAGNPALNAADFGSGMAAGPRFTLFRHTGDQGAIEFNYFRVQSFTAEKSLAGDGGYLQSAHGIYCCPSDTLLRSVSGGLSSSLQSFELNRRFPTDGGWQWLTGFRWVQWQEAISIQTSPGFSTTTYESGTWNDLYGWQAGGDSILYGLGCPFRIEGIGKAGVYYNNAAQSSVRTISAGGMSSPMGVATDAGRVAFVGEIGLTAVYDVADWLSVRAGYAAFWLGGIATATNQLNHQDICPPAESVGRTNTGGSVFVQGITLGLEARY